MEGLLPLAAALSLWLAPAPSSSAAPAAEHVAAPGVRLVLPDLDIVLTTPERWRISMESSPRELVLDGGTERAPIRLRVRRAADVASPRERMRAIAHELGGRYTDIEYEEESPRTTGEREVLVLSASGRDVNVRLFVTRFAPGAEHLFWLSGGSRDVTRTTDDVLALIAGATAASADARPGAGDTFRHRASGLVISAHPRGLAPHAMSDEDLDGAGLVWIAGDPFAPLASLRLTRRSVAPQVDESTAAGTLGSELRQDPDVLDLSSSRERLAERPARRLTWKRRDEEAGTVEHETWFFKSGTSLFRLDLVAAPHWLSMNASALPDFRGSIRFED